MSRRKRTTRTVKFVGGPRAEQVDQVPAEADGIYLPSGTPGAFHRYVGPTGGGFAYFAYIGLVDEKDQPTTEAAAQARFEADMAELMTSMDGEQVEARAIVEQMAAEREQALRKRTSA